MHFQKPIKINEKQEKQAIFASIVQQTWVENLLCAEFCPGLWGQRCLKIVPRPHRASGSVEGRCKETFSGMSLLRVVGWLGLLGVWHCQIAEYFAAVAAFSCFVNWEDLGWTRFLAVNERAWPLCRSNGKESRQWYTWEMFSLCRLCCPEHLPLNLHHSTEAEFGKSRTKCSWLWQSGKLEVFSPTREATRALNLDSPGCRNHFPDGFRSPAFSEMI